ncbi:MAG: hypothetical protein IJS40_03110 [Synergistaceae bacterium]|nr:hypothetical protein [Synergistaceae bacterium]
MEDKEILEKLRANNPFVSSASPLPWDNKNPDLLQLSREASEDIEQLMRHKRREPSTPLAGLVLGEPGSGKTHMLARILRRMRSRSRFSVFVAVRIFRDAQSVTKYLLDEIFVNLKQVHSNGRTQFDMIMSEFANSYQERRRQDGYSKAEIARLDPRSLIARDIPGLERNFLKCFVQYLSTSDPAARNDILDWLSEGLEGEDALKLGLPDRDLNSLSDARREQEAEKVLIALGLILSYAKVSMIICFDQLDAMKDRELISAWGNIINLLMNNLSGILPLCFLRSEIWNDVFMPVLDDAIVQRLRNNTMIMKTCSLEQARLLIRMKIEALFTDDAEEIFQWLIKRMGSTLRDGYSPRVIIELANHAITATGEITESPVPVDDNSAPLDENDIIAELIKNNYEDEYKKVQSEPNAWPPNADQLTLALSVWLNSHDGFEFKKSDLKNMKLIGKYHGRDFSFVVVTGKSHFVASAGLNRGSDFLTSHQKDSYCCYISEEKVHKPTWKQVKEAIKKFENLGGRVILLDANERIKWYALTALINRVDNGDVNLYLSSGNRVATREDIKDFVKNFKLVDFPFDDDGSEAEIINLPAGLNDAVISNMLNEMVEASPMNMLGTLKAIDLLAQRGVNLTVKDLMAFVKRETTFKIYKNANDESIISFS